MSEYTPRASFNFHTPCNGESQIQPTQLRPCVPTSLIEAVPECAVTCVQSFVRNNYKLSSCIDTPSLRLLCTQRTLSGLTIGEGALQCLFSNCLTDDLNNLGVYNICYNIPDSIPETAKTI